MPKKYQMRAARCNVAPRPGHAVGVDKGDRRSPAKGPLVQRGLSGGCRAGGLPVVFARNPSALAALGHLPLHRGGFAAAEGGELP